MLSKKLAASRSFSSARLRAMTKFFDSLANELKGKNIKVIYEKS
ncbi:hypothetical protein [Campylobacter sp.]|nr:hypothetical protein [Campylobacter sp.]MDY4154789.1 hypothetical protein [Campylobacter sp.]